MDENLLAGDQGHQLKPADLAEDLQQDPIEARPNQDEQQQDHEDPHGRIAELLVYGVLQLPPAAPGENPKTKCGRRSVADSV